MKTANDHLSKGRLIFYAVAVIAGCSVQGCAATRYVVLASTGTVIGLEISQNPANQSPQAKLGYNRGELALVPSDRTEEPASGSTRGSAKDVADVIMEIRYGGIFDWGPTSGIYQRLAVGTTAVKQPGASLMFAKNSSGDLNADAVAAIKTLPVIQETVEVSKAAMRMRFQEIYAKNSKAPDLEKFETAAKSVGYPSTGHADYPAFRNFIADIEASPEKAEGMRKSLAMQGIQF
jgi:hypothetical protein